MMQKRWRWSIITVIVCAPAPRWAPPAPVVMFTLSRGTLPIIRNNKLWNRWKTPLKLSATLNIMFDCALMTRRGLEPIFCVKPTDINDHTKNSYFLFNKVQSAIKIVIAVSVSTKEVLVIEQSSTLACGKLRIENKWNLLFVLFIRRPTSFERRPARVYDEQISLVHSFSLFTFSCNLKVYWKKVKGYVYVRCIL